MRVGWISLQMTRMHAPQVEVKQKTKVSMSMTAAQLPAVVLETPEAYSDPMMVIKRVIVSPPQIMVGLRPPVFF